MFAQTLFIISEIIDIQKEKGHFLEETMTNFSHVESKALHLINTQNSRSLALAGLLSLVTLFERHGALVVSVEVVEVLDLVDSNDPVLTGEGFFQS